MYIMRLDDAAENWEKENWHRMHDLLSKYNIKPIIAIIPNNSDPFLLSFDKDKEYYPTIHKWLKEGWTPALHGYDHVQDSLSGGINPVNKRSEFAGKSYYEQYIKITEGYKTLSDRGIKTNIFVAPAHTFDKTTLQALRNSRRISIISDTVANDVYYYNGLFFVPQQSGEVREIFFKVTTFCYHPNTMSDEQFIKLEKFLKRHSKDFTDIKKVKFKKRNKNTLDKVLSALYFTRIKIRQLIKNNR